MSMFRKATREKLKARIALDGPAGSGKTYTGLRFAFALAEATGGRVAVIDTEHRSASKYQGESPDGVPWDFDVCELQHYAPSTYSQVIREAGANGYSVILIDSLSHAWEGVGGALDQVDKKGGNSFTAWKDVTPQHREMVEAILASPCHIIATMRTKMEYVLEEQTNKSGKTVQVPKKVGMAPIQRAGMEYEFDVVCDLDISHTLTVSKTRCPALDGKKAVSPGKPFLSPLVAWLGQGETPVVRAEPEPDPQPAEPYTVEYDEGCEPAGKKTAAAAAAAGGVKLNGKPAGNEYEQDNDCPCGDVIADQIKAAAKALGMPAAKLKEIVERAGVNRLADVPYHEARRVLQILQKKLGDADVPF